MGALTQRLRFVPLMPVPVNCRYAGKACTSSSSRHSSLDCHGSNSLSRRTAGDEPAHPLPVPKQRDTLTRCASFSISDHNALRTPWTESAKELYRQSDRRLSAKLVPTFEDRRCHVVSVTDLLRRYTRLSRPKPLLFLSSNSSIVLTRLSGPRSRPTTY
jgi:hypothetical protein